jgi:ABC-2 type transport system ATP-binding protein
MAQRLMIARALMHEPRLLILDEPTTGLDPQSRLFLWDMMVDLRERGTTLILTTHDMVEADRLCDRIAIIDHGTIIALDTPRRLRRLLPAERGVELTVAAESDPSALLGEVWDRERIEARSAPEGRWRVRLYSEAEDSATSLPAEVLAAAERGGAEVIELKRLEGTLEDVFVHLTGRELRGADGAQASGRWGR